MNGCIFNAEASPRSHSYSDPTRIDLQVHADSSQLQTLLPALFFQKQHISPFKSYIMWHSFLQIYLKLIPLFSLLAIANLEEYEYDRDARQELGARIASARAYNLAHPRNTTELVFGPQLYEAPLFCIPSDPIIPGAYGVRLGRAHSITEHQTAIFNDIRPFIRSVFETGYLEIIYHVSNVDDQLLRAIRSDPKVLLATCSVYDDHQFEWFFLSVNSLSAGSGCHCLLQSNNPR